MTRIEFKMVVVLGSMGEIDLSGVTIKYYYPMGSLRGNI